MIHAMVLGSALTGKERCNKFEFEFDGVMMRCTYWNVEDSAIL